ncbi:hypothetical protein FOCC_FOCC012740 [Frankliniella occidentalis]|nr:hypothetical protein FOCC_FOCC012740 [Frankliniella occidentalis]
MNTYGLANLVKCVCSDTTSSNTGWRIGAIKLLEEGLDRQLIYLACRHHSFEVIPKHLFDELIEKSSSPDIGKLCKRFESEWASLDKEKYTPASRDPKCQSVLTPETVNRIAGFLSVTLQCRIQNYIAFDSLLGQKPQIRGDYEYFLRLVQIFIGECPPSEVKFRPPMALTSARFMGRIIYILSIYMFAMSGQFVVAKSPLSKIRDVCLFVVSTYLVPWFTATNPLVAPRTDLQLLKDIKAYRAFSTAVSKIAFSAFLNHLWYLSPYCVALSFFDDEVSAETKLRMVQNLTRVPPRGNPPKRAEIKTVTDSTELSDFVNSHTMDFFNFLEIKTSFLSLHPSEWPRNTDYLAGLDTVRALEVVNDVAERAVRLTSVYNDARLTKSEHGFQNLLLVR